MKKLEPGNEDLLTFMSDSVSRELILFATRLIAISFYIPVAAFQEQLPQWVIFWLDPRLVIVAFFMIGFAVYLACAWVFGKVSGGKK
jgi:hypothetical protein